MKIIKRLSIFIVCCAFALCSSVSMLVNASYYQSQEPFCNLTITNFTNYLSKLYTFDYYILMCQNSSNDGSYYNVSLICISDEDKTGKLYFSCADYPYDTYLYSGEYSYMGTSTNYSFYRYNFCNIPNDIVFSADNTELQVRSFGNLSSNLSLFCFDNHNIDMFPSYTNASGVSNVSAVVLASNVDLYDYEGNLIQYGNYHTFLQYFGNVIDPYKITDYSGHETAPGVTVPDTTEDNSSDKEQLEVSNNILTNVKNIVKSIFDLPNAVASAIGGFFDTLLNGIINGLKSLFIPSDNLFTDFKATIESKFEFISQITDLGEALIDASYGDEPPNNKIEVYGVTVEFMNWDLYNDYKSLIDGIIIAVSYYFYIQKLIKRIPAVIGGFQKE